MNLISLFLFINDGDTLVGIVQEKNHGAFQKMLDLSRIVQGSGEQFFGDVRLQAAEYEDIGVFRSAGPLKRRSGVGSLLAAQLLQGSAWLVGLTEQLGSRSESGLGLAQQNDAAPPLHHSAGASQPSRQFR